MTVDALQKHYQSFLSRIQQLSTIGGGGETRLEFLDDVDRNSAKVNNKFLRYNSINKKWEGAVTGSSGQCYKFWYSLLFRLGGDKQVNKLINKHKIEI